MTLKQWRRGIRCGDDSTPGNSRLLKALAIVLVVFLAVPGVDAVIRGTPSRQSADAAGLGIDSRFLTEAGDAESSLGRIEELASAGAADVPDAFAEEVGFLPGARDVRVSGDGSVVGYVVSQSCSDALDLIAEQMETGGWTAVSLGRVEGATFIKPEGVHRWALITCTQVDASTSVVVRSVVA